VGSLKKWFMDPLDAAIGPFLAMLSEASGGDDQAQKKRDKATASRIRLIAAASGRPGSSRSVDHVV
jgi:hypothetical protein